MVRLKASKSACSCTLLLDAVYHCAKVSTLFKNWNLKYCSPFCRLRSLLSFFSFLFCFSIQVVCLVWPSSAVSPERKSSQLSKTNFLKLI